MATHIGMDAGLIRESATRLDAQAAALSHAIGSVDAIVAQLSESWLGADARDFVECWQNQHRPAFQLARDAISDLAGSGRKNADQQDYASSAAGVGRSVGDVVETAGAWAVAGLALFITQTPPRRHPGPRRRSTVRRTRWSAGSSTPTVSDRWLAHADAQASASDCSRNTR